MDLPPGWPKRLMHPVLPANGWLCDKFEESTSGTSLDLATQFQLFKVVHYKEAQAKWRHEFVVATILDSSRAQDNRSDDAYLHLSYERLCVVEGDETLRSKLGASSTLSSILTSVPAGRVDKITPLSQIAMKELAQSVKKGTLLCLRQMTFDSPPTLLELAAVLEAHSTLSTAYRLRATMCYWFAGSTYEILQHLYGGQNEDFQHAKKAGKLGPITVYPGYRLMKEKEKAEGMRSLVELVKSFERLGRDKKDKAPDADTSEVEDELRRLPRFDDLCELSRKRRDQVMTTLEERKREEEERREQVAREQAGRAAAEQHLEARGRELELERAGRAAAEQQLEDQSRELEKLREQLGALQSTGDGSK